MNRSLSTAGFVRLLAGWAAGSDPLYLLLAAKVHDLVDEGALPPSTVIPSERALARALGVSRRTIESAYEQLRARGVVASRTGYGTWIQSSTQPAPPSRRPAASDSFVQALLSGTTTLDLTVAGLPAHDFVVRARYETQPMVEDLQRTSLGYAPTGLDVLKDEISSWFCDHGAPTNRDQIAVTSGAAQGLWLAAATLPAGARVVVENPTSPTILTALRGHALAVHPVAADGQGMHVREIPDGSVDAVFLTPAYLNPTGERLSHVRCAELAERSKYGLTVVEDLALVDLRLDGPRPSLVAALAPGRAQVLSIGSMSKPFWAGLRVGWVRAPAPLIRRVNQMKAMLDIGAALDTQAQAAWLLAHRETVLTDRRHQLRQQRDHLLDRVAESLPDWKVTSPDGGLSLWLTLPAETTSILCQRMGRGGIKLLPGRAFDVQGRDERHLRLPFTSTPQLNDFVVDRLSEMSTVL